MVSLSALGRGFDVDEVVGRVQRRHSDGMTLGDLGYRRCCALLGCWVPSDGNIYHVGMLLCVNVVDVWCFL